MNNVLREYADYIKITNGIFSPRNDKLNYRTIELKNKMKIFFIQDVETNISSANMYVNVGTIDNPHDIPGMAHYLEHMLFMGSDMFPGETYFQKHISCNGGATNAFTTERYTQYFFSTSNNFIPLLKIFSRFFVKPLFDVRYVEKEVSAVDSEHNKNISSDEWRALQLSKQFLIDSVNSKFGTGTKETLLTSCNNDPNILRKRLIEFYDTFYSSDRMVLFISHKNISNKLVARIRKMFEEVPCKKTVYTDDRARVREFVDKFELIRFKTVRKTDVMQIRWLIDGSSKAINNLSMDCFDVLSHILGHEGGNSLHHLLAGAGLIANLSATIEHSFNTNSIFLLHIELTKKGYDNWESVLYCVNCYIENLIEMDNLSNKMFDIFSSEMKLLYSLAMKTMEKLDGLTSGQYFATIYDSKKINLRYIPIAAILVGDDRERRNIFTLTLKQLKFNKMKVLLSSSKFSEQEVQKIDKYYTTQYDHVTITINQELTAKYRSTFIPYNNKSHELSYMAKKSNEFALIGMTHPVHNKYLAAFDNLKIIDPIQKNDDNYCLLHSENNNLYYLKKGNTYGTCNLYGMMSIEPKCMELSDPMAYILILVYVMYITKIKNQELYMLRMAQITIDISVLANQLQLTLSACTDNINKIFEDVMGWYYGTDSLRHEPGPGSGLESRPGPGPGPESGLDKNLNTIDHEVYDILYHNIMTDLLNYQYSQSFTRIGPEFRKMLNSDHTISNEQMIHALKKISPDMMRDNASDINYTNFRKRAINLISQGNVTGIWGGSITVAQTNRFITTMDRMIAKPPHDGKIDTIKYYITQQALSRERTIHNNNPNNNEKAIGYGLYMGNLRETMDPEDGESENNWAIIKPFTMILETFISEKFSSLVRTQQEIGYIAMATIININEHNNPDVFLLFVVQSTRDDLKNIVENYIDNNMMHDINSITDDDFRRMKQSIVTKLSEKPINIIEDISEKFTALKTRVSQFNEIEKFDRKQIMINALNKVTKVTQFIKFVQHVMAQNIRSIVLIDANKNIKTV
jgi:secreted Zn-dependent insulinase-like peptidase